MIKPHFIITREHVAISLWRRGSLLAGCGVWFRSRQWFADLGDRTWLSSPR